MFFKIGHRGAAGYEPKNTIRSFQKAIKLGADAIELDVRSTKDGALVVIHDATVSRTTNGCGFVSDYSFGNLRKLNAGGGQAVPSLEEVLERFAKRVVINIELKVEGIAEQILTLLRKHNAVSHTIVSALDDSENDSDDTSNWIDLLWMKRKEPELKIALLVEKEEALERAITIADRVYPGWIWAINPSRRIINPARIQRIQNAGASVLVWTVNDPEEISRLKSWGVDGIFSDYPDRL